MVEVKEVAVSDLRPYERNPRDNSNGVAKVAASIREFGFKVPIVIDRNNVIVCGHTRYLASKELGIEKVPCIVADDLTPKQIQAFRLADNKVAELSGWDYTKLQQELNEVSPSFDMLSFGFEQIDGSQFAGLVDSAADFEEVVKEKEKHSLTCPYCGGEVET